MSVDGGETDDSRTLLTFSVRQPVCGSASLWIRHTLFQSTASTLHQHHHHHRWQINAPVGTRLHWLLTCIGRLRHDDQCCGRDGRRIVAVQKTDCTTEMKLKRNWNKTIENCFAPSGSNTFNDFPDNQLTKSCIYWLIPDFLLLASLNFYKASPFVPP